LIEQSKSHQTDPVAQSEVAFKRKSEGIEEDSTDLVPAPDTRRRPGRIAAVSPELISLLRGTAETDEIAIELADDSDQLSTARGMIWNLLWSIIIWTLFILIVCSIFY
jgi:hypothetical protein